MRSGVPSYAAMVGAGWAAGEAAFRDGLGGGRCWLVGMETDGP